MSMKMKMNELLCSKLWMRSMKKVRMRNVCLVEKRKMSACEVGLNSVPDPS